MAAWEDAEFTFSHTLTESPATYGTVSYGKNPLKLAEVLLRIRRT